LVVANQSISSLSFTNFDPVEPQELRFDSQLAEKMIRQLKERYIADLTKKSSIELDFGPAKQAGWVELASRLHDVDLLETVVEFI